MKGTICRNAVAAWVVLAGLLLAMGPAAVQVQGGGWQWQNPLPTGHTLYGVWGSSADLQDAVSYTWTDSGTKAMTASAAYAGGEVTNSYTAAITSTQLPTATSTVTQSSDDAGLSPECVYFTSNSEIYFGKCTNGQDITSGFRFTNVTIPRHSKILNAYLEFTVDGHYSNGLTVSLFGEATGNAQTFDDVSGPVNRPLTDHFTTWSILSTDPWYAGQRRQTPDLSPVIQEVVDRADWDNGNALAIITANIGPTNPPNDHRRVFAYDRYGNGEEVATLVVDYCDSADLALAKAVQPGTTVRPLEPITFTLAFSNTGAFTATGILITDAVPVEVTQVAFDSSRPVTPTDTVSYTWLLGDLLPGESGVITITGVVSPGLPAGYGFTNTATIAAAMGDCDPANNWDSVRISILQAVPIAADDAYTTTEGVPLAVAAPGVLANDYDPNGDPLTAVLDGPPLSGTLVLNPDGSFTYTPTLDFSGVDIFTYHATDTISDSNVATVTLTVEPQPFHFVYLPLVMRKQ